MRWRLKEYTIRCLEVQSKQISLGLSHEFHFSWTHTPNSRAALQFCQAYANIMYSYLPAIGRFLIVVTFIEDALRIVTQWNDQLVYLKDFRHSTSQPL
jgi:hypothetical protein